MVTEISKLLGYEVWTINPQGFGFKDGKPTGWIYHLTLASTKLLDKRTLERALAKTLAKYGATVLVDKDATIASYYTYTLPPIGNYKLHKIYCEIVAGNQFVIFADDSFTSVEKEDLKPFLS
jgi:hypothetical protein